jgi:hypothetical protein
MTIYRDDLERVYALIEKPEAWTTEYHARDKNGICVDPHSKKAVCWCIDGAFQKCGLSILQTEVALGLPRIGDAPDFNDSHTHSEVLALLKAAIDRAPVRPATNATDGWVGK